MLLFYRRLHNQKPKLFMAITKLCTNFVQPIAKSLSHIWNIQGYKRFTLRSTTRTFIFLCVCYSFWLEFEWQVGYLNCEMTVWVVNVLNILTFFHICFIVSAIYIFIRADGQTDVTKLTWLLMSIRNIRIYIMTGVSTVIIFLSWYFSIFVFRSWQNV